MDEGWEKVVEEGVQNNGEQLLRGGVQKDSEVGSVGRGIVLEGLLESEVGKSRKGRMGIGGDGRIWEDMAREVGSRVKSNSEVRRVG